MPIRLEVIDNGRTFYCFDRRATRKGDGTWEFNSGLGVNVVKPDNKATDWVSNFLARHNGDAKEWFLWINPHAGRMLFAESTLQPKHVKAAVQRQLNDWDGPEECFVIPAVEFPVRTKQAQVVVVISSRDGEKQMSMVKGQVTSDGTICLREMTKENRCGELL